MSETQKVLNVNIVNHHANYQAVIDLVSQFQAAGKLTAVNLGPNFVRYEATCPLNKAVAPMEGEDVITETELQALRALGASANIRVVPVPA